MAGIVDPMRAATVRSNSEARSLVLIPRLLDEMDRFGGLNRVEKCVIMRK